MKNILKIIIFIIGLLYCQTAEQIKQAKKMIQRTGMSESQAKNIAKSQGYSDQQIEAAIEGEKASKAQSLDVEKTQIPELNNSNNIIQNRPEVETTGAIADEELPIMDDTNLEIVDQSLLDIESKAQIIRGEDTYFGYDIFARDPSIFQGSSVGIVDPDYLIGPGDEIIVMLWGETQFRQVLTVDREGFVFIPDVGQVFVNGLNLNLLESKLFRVFSQSYASLNPQGRTPTTFLDVSLGNLRPLRIQVLGEVAQPGAYTVSPSATIFSALYYFNGPTTSGSLRDIHLLRGGEKIKSIDFYDYLLTGKKPEDQKLQLDDVIFIPRRLKTVAIQGEINRSGIYELKPKEGLIDLITIAGNLKITAYMDRAQIDRIVPFEDRAELGMDRMYTDVDLGQIIKSKEDISLQDGDRIQIFSVLDLRQNIVDLSGAVTRPGRYDLGESLKLSELVNNADGVLGDAYMERVDIVRTKSDFTEELIKLDLGKVLEGNLENDIYLQGLDRVRIYSMTEMVPRTYVSINGHVKTPGRFLLQENMTLYDLIFKSGGFIDEEYKKLTYLKRAELVRFRENSDEKEIIPFNLEKVINKQGLANTALRADDAVRIYSVAEIEGETRYVSINGHVKRPGRYELFEKNMTLHDLLFKAGGFDDPLYRSQTFLDRADVIRFDGDRISKSIISFNLDSVLSNKNDKQNIILLPGDEIRVYSETVFNTSKSISIRGVVRVPGSYEMKTNMTLKDLILEAGGLNEDVYRCRVEVARIDPQNNSLDNYAKVITFNIDEKFSIAPASLNGSSKKQLFSDLGVFQLQPYDLITIRPDPYFSDQKQVTISGEVLYPGQYTILSSNEKITDIIERAGGLRPSAYTAGSSFTRYGQLIKTDIGKIIKNPKLQSNITVQDGDIINIATEPRIIEVIGEVNAPGLYTFLPKKRINDMIDIAGGFSQNVNKNDIYIRFPNGTSSKYHRWLNNKKIIDGSVIVVGRVDEQEPIDKTELAKEITSILASLSQAIAMIVLARN